jgi:hypothetical protein
MVEVAGNWRKIPTGKEVELAQRRWGTWPIFEEYGKELIFKEGRTYQIRIAIPCQPGRAGRWDIHRPVSNQVEVEITPASLRPGGEREGEVSIDDGQSTTDEGMEADNDVDNEIRGLAESIFTAIRKADLDRISALFGNLALAAEVSGCGQKWDVSNVQTGEMCLSDKDALLVSTEIYHHQLYTQQIKREAEAKEIRIGLKIHDGKWIAWFVELGQAGDRGKIENFLRKHPEAKNVSLRPGGEREGETEEGIDLVGSVEAQNANPLSYPSALELAHAFMKLSQNGDVKTGELFTEKMTPECVRLLDWCGGTSVRAEIEAEFSRMRSEFQAGLTEEQKQFYSTVRIWQDRGRDVTQNDDRAYVRLLNSKQKGKHWIRTLLLKKQANGSWRITGLYYNTGQLQNDNGIKYFLLNTPATDPAWGDIIEFKISEPRIANGCYIDFDNQKLYDIPQGSVNKQWFAQMGIDGKCGSEQVIGGGGLKGIDLLTKSVDFSKDFPPPKNILLISDQWMRLGSGTGGPLFFKTREGKIGIMIVGGVAKDYDIRFKMLESGNTEGEIETQSSVPSPQSSGEMEAKIQGEAPKGSVFVQVEPLYSADDAKKGIYRWSVRPPDGFVLDLTQHTSHYGT